MGDLLQGLLETATEVQAVAYLALPEETRMSNEDTATTAEERADSSDKLMLWLGSERDRLSVELQKTESDLTVAVHEALSARRELQIVERTSQANANAHMTTHAQLQRLRADYRTLWGMTLGHDGQPPEGAADDVERLRARYVELGDQ